MPSVLRWGVLGTGNIARQFAAGVSTGAPRTALAAVGSRTADAAMDFAKTFGVPSAFGSYEELIASDVDVIYVTLPNSLHHRWTLAALRAGKHVLCEKPIATSAAEARDMFDEASRAGRVLMEGFMYRSHPQTRAVLDAIKSGSIGQVKLIRASFCYRTRRIEGNIRFSKELAGGALMDVGCYCTDFIRLVAGREPDRVDATGHLHESGVDDLAAGTLHFPGGVVGTFCCGMTVQADNTAYVCGSEGYIEIPVPWKPPKENAIWVLARSTPPKMDAVGKPAPATPPRQLRHVNAPAELYALEAEDFAAAVLDRKPPPVTAEQSIGNLALLDRMRAQLSEDAP